MIKTISGQVIIILTLYLKLKFCALCSILGYTPIDGVPKIGIASISLAVTATFIVLHICGIVFALFCLAFNIINRKKRSEDTSIKNICMTWMIIISNFTNLWLLYRVIRLSSPNLNYIIIGGGILTYCSGIAIALPITNREMKLSLCFVSAM